MTMATYENDKVGQMLFVGVTENGTFFGRGKHCKNHTVLTDAGALYNHTVCAWAWRDFGWIE